MIKFLKWTFGIISFLLVAAVIAAIIFINQFDLNKYKPQIEKIVYEQTGRKLNLNGDVGLKISFIPTIAVENAVLGNASWSKNKEMVSIKEADVSLAILPLIRKQIEIGEINIIEATVNLDINKDGEANWVFTKPDAENTENTENTEKQEDDWQEEINAAAAPFLAGFFAQKVDIKNSVINYDDKKSKSKISLQIKSFELSAEDNNDDIDLLYDIVFNGQDIKGSARGDSINTILQNKPYNVSLDTQAYGATLKAKALLTDLMGDLGFEANINLLSPNGNFGLPKTEILADVKGSTTLINATLQKLDFGGNVIKGTVKADISGAKPNITANINSALIDLMKLSAQKKTAQIEIFASAHAASFVPDEKLDLSVLNTVNANVKFSIQKLVANEDISLSDVKGTLDVKNGVLNLNPFSAVAGGGNISGNASLNAKGNVLAVKLEGKDIIAQDFVKSLVPSDTSHFGFLSGGKTDLNVDIKSSGETYPKLVENLSGQILFVVGQSKLQAGAMKYLKGNFISQLLSSLNIQAKDPKMSLKCAVLRADFKDGKANFPKGIVFNSKKMVVVGDGDINLKNDKINIAIKPFNGNLTDTNIAQALSSLVKIGGTVSNPGIAVDTASVVKNVVGVAMTGPAYLGSQLLLDADPAPCYTALKNTVYSDMFEAPTGVKAGAQNVYQGTSDIISGGINLVTGTAGGVAQGGADIVTGTAKGMLNLLTGNKKQKKE